MNCFPSVVIVAHFISVALAVHHLKHSLKTKVLFCYEFFLVLWCLEASCLHKIAAEWWNGVGRN